MWSLVRIDHTCLGRSGGLVPISFPLFQGYALRRRRDGIFMGLHSRAPRLLLLRMTMMQRAPEPAAPTSAFADTADPAPTACDTNGSSRRSAAAHRYGRQLG